MKAIVKILFWAMGLMSSAVYAQQSAYWQAVQARDVQLPSSAQRVLFPEEYALFRLNASLFMNEMQKAPQEAARTASKGVVMELPLPDGSVQRFRVYESPVMAPALAAKYPAIKTYVAQGIDDPTATARLGWTPTKGFHAIIRSKEGTVYIDPYAKGQKEYYMSYFRSKLLITKNFFCEVDGAVKATQESVLARAAQLVEGNELRVYRLALAATGEYTQYHGGTVAAALDAMVTTINRVNEIYEQDLAVRLVLIDNTDLLIYTDPTTDPYSNNDGYAMLSENQSNVDAVIGSANYDIGHVFSTGGGGIAGLGVICSSGQKARGVTGSTAPEGDAFDVDYVCHEIGHQFGANHTFNAEVGACAGNKAPSAAFEPWSGSTIMAYAGICAPFNLQNHSDPYFHIHSIQEIQTTIASSSCASVEAVNNTAPAVSVSTVSYTIPHSTPFFLAGTATDSEDEGLTYCWEEYDLEQDGLPPLFRSYLPTTSGIRVFPSWDRILSNTNEEPELLPSTNRSMNFRLTVRDNHAGGGGVSYESASLNVTTAAGPFRVTYPNSSFVTWYEGDEVTINWDVANTDLFPVNCQSVDIYLSKDGGATFPAALKLASGVPNTGSYTLTCPAVTTTQARIMIVAADNVFFDVSDNNFTIFSNVVTAPDEELSEKVAVYPNPSHGVYVIKVPAELKDARALVFNTLGEQVAAQIIGQERLELDLQSLPAGVYVLTIRTERAQIQKRLIKER
ncbi:reprolysin-like metallopeptidase [Thermonema sp.]|uniref:reprolysin-like metallopeptidase n=1 Tax=Thermonema sp. TaxID=2231181 RepID=UPI002590358D|nr:zinc-dependent metalloprotease family protein [Thermonema sp.]